MKQKDLTLLSEQQSSPEYDVYIGYHDAEGNETVELAKCVASAPGRFLIIGESACIKDAPPQEAKPEPEKKPRHLKVVK